MQLPSEVTTILDTLAAAGHEAYVVGGCVRDLLLRRTPADWDITTSAEPADIQRLFPRNFYNNQFGTVTVLSDGPLKAVEVTTYRVDAYYSDARHPDTVQFTRSLVEDLARRDFTINALALNQSQPGSAGTGQARPHDTAIIDNLHIIDPFGGLKDLNAKAIRAVGDPTERFQEDALRLLRAVRFAAELGFTIEPATLAAMTASAEKITAVSAERIRDEIIKIVQSDSPEAGFTLLHETGLLTHIVPELAEGVGVEQNKHHIYTVFDHCVKSLQFAANYDYALPIRLAALWHDIGKPRTRRFAPVRGGAPHEGDYTFYGHEIVGARMTEQLMRRLRFPAELTQHVSRLVRHHMFYYDVGKVTEAGARRLLRRVGGPALFQDLIKLRIAERKGSGVPKAEPYRLRHLQFLVEKAAKEPVSVGQLAIGGNDLITEVRLKPGPQIGGILNALLAEVLDDPAKNTREYLLQRARALTDADPAALKQLGETAKEEEEQRREDDIRRKYHV